MIASLSVIIVPLVFSIPPFSYVSRRIKKVFSDLVPYRSLIPAEPATKEQRREETKYRIAAWAHILLLVIALGGTAIWSSVFGINLLGAIWRETGVVEVLLSAGVAFSWVRCVSLGHSREWEPAHQIVALPTGPAPSSTAQYAAMVGRSRIRLFRRRRFITDRHEVLRQGSQWTYPRVGVGSMARTSDLPDYLGHCGSERHFQSPSCPACCHQPSRQSQSLRP